MLVFCFHFARKTKNAKTYQVNLQRGFGFSLFRVFAKACIFLEMNEGSGDSNHNLVDIVDLAKNAISLSGLKDAQVSFVLLGIPLHFHLLIVIPIVLRYKTNQKDIL